MLHYNVQCKILGSRFLVLLLIVVNAQNKTTIGTDLFSGKTGFCSKNSFYHPLLSARMGPVWSKKFQPPYEPCFVGSGIFKIMI